MENPRKYIPYLFPLVFLIPLAIQNKFFFEIDELLHYTIIKDSILNPSNLLSPYGKFGYSIIGFLFVYGTGDRFGLVPLRLMNILIIFFTSLLIVKIWVKEKHSLKSIWVFYISLGNQLFLLYGFSALTEPLSGFILIAALYQEYEGKSNKAALFLSYGFLVRPEMIFPMLFFGLKYLKERKFKEILLFSVFPLIWCLLLIGNNINPMIILTYNSTIDEFELQFKDVPYLGDGIMSFMYWIIKQPQIIGWVGIPFWIFGVYIMFRRKEDIILPTLLTYFLFQGFILAMPGFGSSGLIRYYVMMGPFNTMIILKGIDGFLLFNEKKLKHDHKMALSDIENLKQIFTTLVLLLIFINSILFIIPYFNFKKNSDYLLQEEAGEFLQDHFDLKTTKVYAPGFGSSKILEYLYHPSLYFDFQFKNRDINEIVTNYSVIPWYGYFEGFIHYQDFTQPLDSDNIVIWYSILNNNSYFNPHYINLTNFEIIYQNNSTTSNIVIYKVL